MGNKQVKLDDKEKKSSKKNRTKRSASAHEIIGPQNDQGGSNTTSPFTRGFRGNSNRPGLQKYQSYSGPSTTANGPSTPQREAPSEVKIYRQTASSGPTGGRYRSLPRNMVQGGQMSRSRSVTSSIYQSNGTLNREPLFNNDNVSYKRYSHIPASSHYPNLNDTRDSMRSSVSGLNTTMHSGLNTSYREPTSYRVVADDFPDTSAIKRRLAQFETQFAKCFTALYSRLSETVQLSAISIALCLGPNGRHQISLYQYLTSEDIPLDLNELQRAGRSPNREQYILTIPESLFHGVKHIRSQRIPDRKQWLSLAKELVTCLAVEVADELSRIFEYQIALLGDGLPIDLLARTAVDFAVEYLKIGNRFLERNTLIAGVIRGGPRGASDPVASKVISVVIGEREFKWNLSQIFKRCGLRKETLLFSPKSSDSSSFVPWTYYTSPDSNAPVYGYRGIVLDRDPEHGYYMVTRDDEFQFTQAVGWNPEDIHRRYNPFRRLIGKEVMDEYCAVTKNTENVTLAEYVSKLQGYDYGRDTIQPIYRPLGMISGLSRGSRNGSNSVSSLLSSGSVSNRAMVRRDEEVAARLHSQFPSVKQIQVTSTVMVRNPPTPTHNGHHQSYNPRTGISGGRGYRSETCSIASEDYDRYERDVPSDFGAPRFRNSATFTRQDPQQPRRLYQSQRPHSARSVSNYNPGSNYNYGRTASPGFTLNHNRYPNSGPGGFNQAPMVNHGPTNTFNRPPSVSPDSGFIQTSTSSRGSTMVNQGPSANLAPTHVAREINAPSPSHNRDFLDFNAFLGMIKEGETVPNGNTNGSEGQYGSSRYDTRPRPQTNGPAYSSETNNRVNGNIVYPSRVNGNTSNGVDPNYRRTALSHV